MQEVSGETLILLYSCHKVTKINALSVAAIYCEEGRFLVLRVKTGCSLQSGAILAWCFGDMSYIWSRV